MTDGDRGSRLPSAWSTSAPGMGREIELTVTVEEVIYRSADQRFAVLRASVEGAPQVITLVGPLGSVSPGDPIAVHGRPERHATFGERIVVTSFTPVTPQTREGIRRYLGSGRVPGVGPAIADRIVDKFGERTLEVISTQSSRLREVSGIGLKTATKITDAVRAHAADAQVFSFLHGLGIGNALSQRIVSRYKADTVRVVREEPYRVAEEVRGVGFLTADRIGRQLGYTLDDPRRAAGAVLHLLGRGADEGNVYLPRELLVEQAQALEVPHERANEAIDMLHARGMVIIDGDAVYAPPLYSAEVSAARKLQALAEHPNTLPPAIPEALLEGLAPAQRDAVRASFVHRLYVLTGGPGTGKTTTVRALVAAQRAQHKRVLLCAPTGRAAKRLSEATGAEAATIHRALEYNPKSGAFQRNADLPLEADVVLVDEASMLDLVLGERLLSALSKTASLVLVGDVDQLPPIGAGPLLRELISSNACPVIRLTVIFRQAQRSAIVRAAHAILSGERPEPTAPGERGEGDYFFIRATDPESAQRKLLETLTRAEAAYGLDPKRDVQVLTPMRKGPLGIERLNHLIQTALNPGPGEAGMMRPGDKVMQLRNDYDREVFNGDLGEIEHVSADVTLARMSGRSVPYDRDAREALSLAYACTVHKVQGSEFPAIVVLLHTTHFIMLSRALLYTAVTRAKRLVVVIGDERALQRAVSHVTMRQTYSGLRARLARQAPDR
jgi:exodeoxyribonuclease V alpha subunit